jgi:hypothetical protein
LAAETDHASIRKAQRPAFCRASTLGRKKHKSPGLNAKTRFALSRQNARSRFCAKTRLAFSPGHEGIKCRLASAAA